MSRLTKNNKGDFCYAICEKLGEYEDLEEQDRLIKLPCRIGDTVYVKMEPYCKTHYAEAKLKELRGGE